MCRGLGPRLQTGRRATGPGPETATVSGEADWEEGRASAPPGGLNQKNHKHTRAHMPGRRGRQRHISTHGMMDGDVFIIMGL